MMFGIDKRVLGSGLKGCEVGFGVDGTNLALLIVLRVHDYPSIGTPTVVNWNADLASLAVETRGRVGVFLFELSTLLRGG